MENSFKNMFLLDPKTTSIARNVQKVKNSNDKGYKLGFSIISVMVITSRKKSFE